MEKISSYISKKVISLNDGNLVGYVLNVFFDDNLKVFKGLIVADEESENTFVLEKEDIASKGEDCVMIDSSFNLQFNISSLSNNPIGKLVYDCHGNCLGRVIDVEVFGKMVKKIITDKCEFPQHFIRKSGDNFIIFGRSTKTKKQKKFSDFIGDNNKENLPNSYISINALSSLNEGESPTRLFANANALIGKIITHDIIGLNNERIAKKFEVIDKKIINRAKEHNKLKLLAFYSK